EPDGVADAVDVAEDEEARPDDRVDGGLAAIERDHADGGDLRVGHEQAGPVGRQAARLREQGRVHWAIQDVLGAGARPDAHGARGRRPVAGRARLPPSRSVWTIRLWAVSAMKSRFPSASASTLPGKDRGESSGLSLSGKNCKGVVFRSPLAWCLATRPPITRS